MLNVTISHTNAVSVLVHWVSNGLDGGQQTGRKDVWYAVILLLTICENVAQCCQKKMYNFHDSPS